MAKEIPNKVLDAVPDYERYCVACAVRGIDVGPHFSAHLPEGWNFVSHEVKERDSFGPVTSLLVLRGPNGKLYERLI